MVSEAEKYRLVVKEPITVISKELSSVSVMASQKTKNRMTENKAL